MTGALTGVGAQASPVGARAAALCRCFALIGASRMLGVPVMNPALVVEAIGFEPCVDADGAQAALGILLTPWFMNLIWLPMAGQPGAPQGKSREHQIGGECFHFIGAHEDSFGSYEMCSLFSPMFEFASQAAARATGAEVLQVLRSADRALAAQLAAQPSAGRRGFLTGRMASRPAP